MAILGFEQFATIADEDQLILREVMRFQAKETICGSDLLSGEDLDCIQLGFGNFDFFITCLADSDEIKISRNQPGSSWHSTNISQEEPWIHAIGLELTNAWQLCNIKGYDDGICLHFSSYGSNFVRVLLEAVASRFSVFHVLPSSNPPPA